MLTGMENLLRNQRTPGHGVATQNRPADHGGLDELGTGPDDRQKFHGLCSRRKWR